MAKVDSSGEDSSDSDQDQDQDQEPATAGPGGDHGPTLIIEGLDDSDSDSDDSDSDDDDDEFDEESEYPINDDDLHALTAEITHTEEALQEDPYSFRLYNKLIYCLRIVRDKKKLLSAYRKLNEFCPLTSKMWIQRLKLEGEEETVVENRIDKLYAKAVVDCYDVDLYYMRCENAVKSENLQFAREVLTECRVAAGCDPAKGGLVWDVAREFEYAVLAEMNAKDPGYGDQLKLIFDLYAEQLSSPIYVSEELLRAFDEFYTGFREFISGSEVSYLRVKRIQSDRKEISEKLLEFEERLDKIKKDESELERKFEKFSEYIAFVEDLRETRRGLDVDLFPLLLSLYDRATSSCCAPLCRINKDGANVTYDPRKLCREYFQYAKEKSSKKLCINVLDKVNKRCPRSVQLWTETIHFFEETGSSIEEIRTVFEEALSGGFDSAQDYVSIWLCYLEALRRKTDFQSEEEIAKLRKTFRLAWNNLSQMWGDAADQDCIIMLFWMRIEYQLIKDYESGKELFEEIIGYGNNRYYIQFWNEFIAMERVRGGITSARAAYKRAIKNCQDQNLIWGWLALERDFGTLLTMKECSKTVSDLQSKWKDYNEPHQQPSDNSYEENNYSKQKGNKSWLKNKQEKNYKKNVPNRKRKHEETNSEKSPNKKETKPPPEEDVFAVPKPPPSRKRPLENSNGSPSKKFKGTQEACPPPPGFKPDSEIEPPPGFVEDHNPDTVEDEKNNRTAFISNLAFKTEEEQLREKLGEFGEVLEIRLMKSAKTFGCICYCVYSDKKAVEVALSHDRELLNDRPMFISRYSSEKDRKKHFIYSTGIERNKLFVKGIPFDHCTSERLSEIFAKYGKLKDIRVVTFKTGKPKGIAYVEYEDEKSASAAIQGVDGMEINGRQMSVALSAPPPKKADPSSTASTNPPANRSHSRTQLFIPSVLKKAAPVQNNGTSAGKQSAPLNNADFRKLFQK